MISNILASRYSDISFIVMLAGPGVPFDCALITANEKKLRSQGKSEEIVQAGTDLFERMFKEIKKKTDYRVKKGRLSSIINEWKLSLTSHAKNDIQKFMAENPTTFPHFWSESCF